MCSMHICKVCRLCGVEKNAGHDLFDSDSIRIGLLSKIIAHLPKEILQIDASDNLTKFICHDCVITIDHFAKFCEMIKKTQETLYDSSQRRLSQLEVVKCPNLNENTKEVVVSVSSNNKIRCEICLANLDVAEWMNHWHIATRRSTSVYCACQECAHVDEVNNFIKENSVICPSCFFSTRSEPTESLQSDKRKYICEICKKSFRSMGHKNRHKMIHDGLKPFLCDTCGVGFSQKVSLKTHLLTHTNNYPHTCEWCGLAFRHKVSLQSHIINVHSINTTKINYECNQCNKVFASNHKLTRHYRSHTGAQPYSCGICNKSFSQTGNLKTHLKKHKSATEFSDIDTPDQMLDSPTQKILGDMFTNSGNGKDFIPLRNEIHNHSLQFDKNNSTLRKETLQDVFSGFDPHNCSIYSSLPN